MGVPIETLSFGIGVFRGVPELTPADQSAFSSAESDANSTGLNTSDMKKWVEDVTNILSSTLESVQPISFDVDKKIGTDKTVFAIHGPNMGNYGGAEVAIVFKNMALRHPDAFLTPVAAMGYYQGWYVKNSRVGTDRPWIGNAKPWQSGGQEDYLSSIFQVSTQYWAEACAMEWIARVVQQGRTGSGPRREPRDVSLADVQEMWRNADPHTAIEAHLPGFIPLSLVDRVFVCSSAPGAAEVCESLRAMKIQCVAVADTKTAVWNYMAAPAGNRSSNMHTEGKGCYDFFVEGGCGGKECTVPVDIVEAGVRSVSFEAVNGGMTTDLMVTISDTPSAARAPGKGHCVTFRLPPFDTNVYAYELPPGDVVGKGKTQPLTSGSFGAPATVSRYTISVGDGVLVLMNDKTKKPAEVKFQRQMCRFVSFSAETYPLLIKDCYLN